MIAVVPKFKYFQMYVDHKDTSFGNIFDDINIANVAGSSNAPPMPQNHGHEPRRSRRTNVVEEAAHITCDGSDKTDSSDSEWDSELVDSDNELAKDDDDLFNEWVDTDFGKKTKKGSKREVDSDYDSDDFEEKKDSENEEDDSAEEVENFVKNWRGEIFKNKLWQIARATREADWQKYMDEMKALDQEAFEYLNAIYPRQWCKAFFEELPKCDLLLNNSCKVFNKYILPAREMPIVTSLKKIKDQLMTRFHSKSNEPEEWYGTICPKIRKKLDKNIDWSNNYQALPAAKHLFKVIGLFGEYEVDIKKMECSCRAWQLSGITCRHACACLRHERIKPEDVVNKRYNIEAFKLAYGQVIMPCSDPKVWKKMYGPTMGPPKLGKQVGRPSKKRKKNPLEEDDGTRMSMHGIIGHCGVCNEPGHNRRKCPHLGRGPQATEILVEKEAQIPVEQTTEIPVEEEEGAAEIPMEQATEIPVQIQVEQVAEIPVEIVDV
ncbi:transposon mutator sub-class [Hordeum vulgare]|nr:transposon mutator sub-class [Hordeum vulgare]